MHDKHVKLPLAAALLVLTLLGVSIYLLTQFGSGNRRDVQLSDGTRFVSRGDSQVIVDAAYPNPRHVQVDGDVFMSIPAGSSPMTVTTRLFKLDISRAAELRLSAHSKQAGEQVQVLCGQVTVHKNYASSHAEPDDLTANTMSMVNESIDLMEREAFSAGELTNWLADLGLSSEWVRSRCEAMTHASASGAPARP